MNTWLTKFFTSKPITFFFVVGFVLVSVRLAEMYVGKSVLFGDNYSLMVPGKLFTTQWLLQGILPFWNPTIFAGIPWIGDINQSIFYPSTVLFLFLHPAIALNITIIGQLIITFVGMARLTRQQGVKHWPVIVSAALLWSFSPQIIGSMNNISTLQSLTWMPWVVLFGQRLSKDRTAILYFSLVVFLQLLGGYPQHVFYSVVVAGLFSLFSDRDLILKEKKWFRWVTTWFLAGVVSLLLSAVVLLPFIPTLLDSSRTVQSSTQAAAGSLEVSELIKVVLPHFFDDASQGMKWGPSWNKPVNVMLYFTWFSLVIMTMFLFLKKKLQSDWFYLTLILGSIFLALGSNFFLFGVLQHIPLFKFSRGLSTILMIPALIVPLWCASLLTRITVSKKIFQWFWKIVPITIVLLAIILVVVDRNFSQVWQYIDHLIGNKLSLSPFHTLERDEIIFTTIFRDVILNGLFLALAIWAWQSKKWTFWILVLLLDMIINTRGHIFFAPNKVYDPSLSEKVTNVLDQADLSQYRVLTRNYNFPYTDFGAYWDALAVRQPFSDSYIDETELAEFNHLQRMKNTATPNWNMVENVPIINGYTTLLPQSIQDEFLIEAGEASINNLPEIQTDNPQLQKWAVKYYAVDTWFPPYQEDFPDTLSSKTEGFTIYELPNVLPRFRYEDNSAVEYSQLTETPNSIQLTLNNAHHTKLILADRYDQRWKATINGLEVVIEDKDSQRQIALVSGENVIEIRYVPTEFYLGMAISAIMALSVLVYWLYLRRQLSSPTN